MNLVLYFVVVWVMGLFIRIHKSLWESLIITFNFDSK